MFKLPIQPNDTVRIDPQVLVLYGGSKVGKTTAIANLSSIKNDTLLIDCEKGAEFVKVLKISINSNVEFNSFLEYLRTINSEIAYIYSLYITQLQTKFDTSDYTSVEESSLKKFNKEFHDVCFNMVKEQQQNPNLTTSEYLERYGLFTMEDTPKEKYFYKRLVLDNLSILEDWSDQEAIRYYKKLPAGKDFNNSHITILPMGLGYQLLADELFTFINKLKLLADEIILIGHIKDKHIKTNNSELAVTELKLPAKISANLCAMSDAIGQMYRNGKGQLVVSFKNSELNQNTGSRCEHLKGAEIILHDPATDEYYWDKIYKTL